MKSIICINCPTGCEMEVEENNGKITVTGNGCPRGKSYAEAELSDPRRVVTAVVHCTDGRCQSVRTDKALPRKFINALLNRILHQQFPPASPGSVLLEDIEGTGVKLIATSGAR